MYNCMAKLFDDESEVTSEKDSSNSCFQLFDALENKAQFKKCIDNIYWIYKDTFTDGCADGIGYILSIDRVCNTHQINILTTIYALLVSDANIYMLYESSFFDKDNYNCLDIINPFLDELLNLYKKAEKITVVKEMTYSTDTVIEYFAKRHKDIKHIIDFGDFCQFNSKINLFQKIKLRVHLPAAHYVIMNYSSENISARDKQILYSFGNKCSIGYVDYSGYVSDDNKHHPVYGFDIDSIFSTDLSMFYLLKEIKHLADKVTTIVFTDKTKDELGYPKEFYDCCEVYFSKNFNDNILNYDFTQLFK